VDPGQEGEGMSTTAERTGTRRWTLVGLGVLGVSVGVLWWLWSRLKCHATTTRSARERTGPEAADHAIGCEGYHGPGGLHPAAIAVQFPDPAILNLTRASPAALNQLCGGCHSQHLLEMPASKADPAWARFPGLLRGQVPVVPCRAHRARNGDCRGPGGPIGLPGQRPARLPDVPDAQGPVPEPAHVVHRP
jgi:hypothetical protein